MELTGVRRAPSPRDAALVRLTGDVRSAAGATSEWWVEVPEEIAGDLTTSGTPWLAWLLPAAAALKEPLTIRLPVDGLLLERTRELLEIWHMWDPRLAVVDVRAEVRGDAPAAGRRTVAFFSGGVDSLFTALRPRHTPIDDLLLLRGSLDFALTDTVRFEGARASVERLARGLGRRLVHVTTNVPEQLRPVVNMQRHGHAPLFCGAALALEPRFSRLLYPASVDVTWLLQWGTHPVTDILQATRGMRIDTDGVGLTRIDKIRAIAAAPEGDLALAELRVCFRSPTGGNCSRCEKCLRTMITLLLLGCEKRALTFDWTALDARRLTEVQLWNDAGRVMWTPIEELARAQGRPDVARAIRRALRRSRRNESLRRTSAWLRGLAVVGPVFEGARALLRPARGEPRG